MGEGGREGGRYEEKRSGETGELPRRAQIRARMLGRRWKDETREKQIARRPYGYRTLRTSDLRMTRLYLPLSLFLSRSLLLVAISRVYLCTSGLAGRMLSRPLMNPSTQGRQRRGRFRRSERASRANAVIKLWSHYANISLHSAPRLTPARACEGFSEVSPRD